MSGIRGVHARCPWRAAAWLAAAWLAVCVAGCGGSGQPPVYSNTYSYLADLAGGNFTNACSLLDGRARLVLERSAGHKVSCARAFAVCLPSRVLVASQDQSQLLYATVELSVHGSKAVADLKGTPVADALKRVSLAKQRGLWKLTSYGDGLTGCARRHHRRHRAH
ncbi:MAG: hypothetical protein WAK93_06345 [Solirubrobacteraceae bacterium]